jgi:hypothetical protein
LRGQIDRIRGAGGELVVVGAGKGHWLAAFRQDTGWDGPLFADPVLASYRAAQLKHGRRSTYNAKNVVNAVRTMARGFRQKGVQGDPLQQGGVLVIVPPGQVVYRHVSPVAGDNAPAAEVAAALEGAVG